MLKGVWTYRGGGSHRGVQYALIAAAVVISGYFVYAAWTSDDEPLKGTWICMTEGCGYTTERAAALGADVPAKCPRCGQTSLVPGYACPKCRKRLILNVYRGLPEPTRCPNCGAEVWYGR